MLLCLGLCLFILNMENMGFSLGAYPKPFKAIDLTLNYDDMQLQTAVED